MTDLKTENDAKAPWVTFWAICVSWLFPIAIAGGVINGVANKLSGSQGVHMLAMPFFIIGFGMFIGFLLGPLILYDDEDY